MDGRAEGTKANKHLKVGFSWFPAMPIFFLMFSWFSKFCQVYLWNFYHSLILCRFWGEVRSVHLDYTEFQRIQYEDKEFWTIYLCFIYLQEVSRLIELISWFLHNNITQQNGTIMLFTTSLKYLCNNSSVFCTSSMFLNLIHQQTVTLMHENP